MFNQKILQDVLVAYKKDFFPYLWEDEYNGTKYDNEKFKWEAVKTFQDKWDIKATDFAGMLEEALLDTGTLLDAKVFPKGMIIAFAKKDPEKVRAMFLNLYDEKQDVVDRISAFKTESQKLLAEYWDDTKSHFQDDRAIVTYLWLRFPDKYYIYRYTEAKKTSEVLESNYPIKAGATAQNIRNYLKLYDEVCAAISKDQELTAMLKEHLTNNCYPDAKYKTLTFDVSFYITHHYAKGITARGRYEKTPGTDLVMDNILDENPLPEKTKSSK